MIVRAQTAREESDDVSLPPCVDMQGGGFGAGDVTKRRESHHTNMHSNTTNHLQLPPRVTN
jgi:hypothetical protein